MFSFRTSVKATSTTSRVEVAFTDSSIDVQGPLDEVPAALTMIEGETGVRFARLNQVHGDEVCVVGAPLPGGEVPDGDALVTSTPGLGLMIRVADCVPVVLADVEAGVIAAAHSGRVGTALGIATRTVERMRDLGATDITAWIGPHVCGACYEVPEEMREAVAKIVPEARSTTRWRTPSLDLGAAVAAQLERAGVEVHRAGGCTVEDVGLHSHRRDGAAAGRMAALVWLHADDTSGP